MRAFIVTVLLRPCLVRSSSLSRWTRQFHCCVAELGRVRCSFLSTRSCRLAALLVRSLCLLFFFFFYLLSHVPWKTHFDIGSSWSFLERILCSDWTLFQRDQSYQIEKS
ncbi:hypothetical protein PIB30_050602 [Stylosanthes scabra]|uniref:Transmembrane protein n=1 Tax=Stylosanthes scabra TaxID=79078 RepID=A0ABU6WFQ6_9FABA|nr:hypothetical protein [Stylosanthes scabra]